MTAGTQVYHTTLRMNLIVCQIDAKGNIICINPKVHTDNKFQVLTVKRLDLVVGWRTMYD